MKITIKVKDEMQLKKVIDNFSGLNTAHIEYGFFQDDDLRSDGLSNIQIAKRNFYGSGIIPSRDMFRPVVMYNIKGMLKLMKTTIKKNIMLQNSRDIVMSNLQQFVNQNIKETFATKGYGTWKPNSPYTVRKKGFNHPLVEIGELSKAMKAKIILRN